MADERDELDRLLADAGCCCLSPMSCLGCRARSIRARERKLAELARGYAEAVKRMQSNPAALFNRGDWLRRYEEACK